jgi:membrane protease YdiL (CAAX protease family)
VSQPPGPHPETPRLDGAASNAAVATLTDAAPADAGATAGGAAASLGVLPTFGWALLIFVAAQIAATAAVAVWNLIHDQPLLLIRGYDGPLIALLTLVTNPVQVLLLIVVVQRWNGRDAIEYLAIRRFSLNDFLIGFFLLAALAAAVNGIGRLIGHETVSTFETEIFTTSRAAGWLPVLFVAIIVVAPIGEELFFRGFLFRGWVTPDDHGVFAVIVIAELFSAMHLQYDWFGMTQVFLTGLLLGWIRWRTDSCLLTIVLHMLVNLESTVEAMVRVGGSL